MMSDIIFDKAGRPVDCTGNVWKLNVAGSPVILNWTKLKGLPEPIYRAAREYARYRMRDLGPGAFPNLFNMLKHLCKCPCLGKNYNGTLPVQAFEELRDIRKLSGSALTFFRGWYHWAATMELPGFDRSVSRALAQIKIGENPQGHPARKKDPKLGPLNDAERQELFEKAISASDRELPLNERVAILLSMGLGPNPGPMALLQVKDFRTEGAGKTKYGVLNIPRHKKGFDRERTDFRTRQIDNSWIPYVERLISRNLATADRVYKEATGEQRPDYVAIPIFMRATPRFYLQPSMREYALHMAPLEYTYLLKQASDRLKVRSRFGSRLHLNARRLRSTFATNLIADGKSKWAVADALDHSSIRYIDRYEYSDYRIVESLDARLGPEMQTVVQAFLGTLTERASEAERNRPPSSRVRYFDQADDHPDELGNCGQNSLCGRAAPLACYSCPSFEPWRDAPHDRLLAQLKEERDRKAKAAMHPRIVALNDRDIQAVGEVVTAIEASGGNSQ